MRFDYRRPNGTWSPEYVPSAADYRAWDIILSKAVNGDLGGTYAPASPIVIGGTKGLASSASGTVMTGGVTTQTGGRLIIDSSANDLPAISPSVTRTVQVPISTAQLNNGGSAFAVSPTFGWGAQGEDVYLEIPGRYMHVGSTLLKSILSFVVLSRPASLPSEAMQAQLSGSDDTGAAKVQQMNPSGSGYLHTGGNITTWAGTHAVSLGQYWAPLNDGSNVGYYYKVTSAGSGTTASAQPTWPTTIGATVTDANSVTWTCVGKNGWYPFNEATVDTYYAHGAVQTLEFDYDGAGPGSGFTNVIAVSQRYQLNIRNLDLNVFFTGFELVFGDIATMAFE